ncbi:MAG: YitT family protein [Candidatus Choladocola sp.]|nr:YitT family protein [Candidatus Choladocola sp.]
MGEKGKKLCLDLLVDICSGVLLTVAIYCFAIPADFPMTGVSGVSLILYHLFGLPVGLMTVLLNIPIILCCYKTLGKQFYLNSLKTTLITSTIMDLLGPRLPAYEGELILAAICAGVLCGAGYAIVFMRNSSTGGFDFITMAIRYYHPHLSLGKIAFVTDGIVILIGGLLIGSVDGIIYGIILNYLYTTVLDKILYGTSSGKLTLIITDLPQEIVQAIDEISGRGATILKAVGGYSGEDKGVVMCASNKKEMYAIRKRAHEVDKNAFVIIVESNEVIGEGFRLPGDTNVI